MLQEGIIYEIKESKYKKGNTLLDENQFIGWENEDGFFTDITHLNNLNLDEEKYAEVLDYLLNNIDENSVIQNDSFRIDFLETELERIKTLYEEAWRILIDPDKKKALETLVNNIDSIMEDKEGKEDNKLVIEQLEIIKGMSATAIAKRYNKTNTNKFGVSTTELYLHVGGKGNPTEKNMAIFIAEVNK